eukprot:TRINITY_DN1286_c0_g1_i13.p1 TRINITY_DN1286_c0_g1~~TRINITY_DN1286_c0_g1_i13.p1  ORF type:complete len:735 (-),score=192.46 TRINITY_DN1286_c0_g1_i13:151-2355(-)
MKYYETVMNPIFLNFVSLDNNNEVRDDELFKAYRTMNQVFMSTVVSICAKNPKAMVLFNDPYFLLAPKMAPEVNPPRMGYFFHSPFPSYELYRIFPASQEFLESALCCDTVAFQVYEYARHFFTSCHRILGLEAESRRGGSIGIIYKGRDVLVRVVHVGISKEYTLSVLEGDKFKEEVEKLRKATRGKTVVAGVERMSLISGIKNKLIAYEGLLKEYRECSDRVLLVQYCTVDSKWGFDNKINNEIRELVKRINTKFPNSILYEEGPVSNEKRLALFMVAEVLLITSLRDGFCLAPFEFMIAKEVRSRLRHQKSNNSLGTVILSEFAGCVSAMSSICRVNPYVTTKITEELYNAVQMAPVANKKAKFKHDLEYIESHSTENWIRSLVADIKSGRNKNEVALYLGAISNKILKAGRQFKNLTLEEITSSYVKAVNRVILLDVKGTIIPNMPKAVIETIDEIPGELSMLLEYFCSDERNTVYILCGYHRELVDKLFGKVLKLGLAAEYGYHFRPPNETEWKTINISQNMELSEKILDIFRWYTSKTDGSEIEVKGGALAWVYRECDLEFGNWQAKELGNALKALLANHPELVVTHDQGFVEVKIKRLEKGECAKTILEEVKKRKGNIDFVCAMGDDIANEHMFSTLNSLFVKEAIHSHGKMKSKDCSLFTCTVGRKPSHASYYVNDYKDVLMLLSSMVSCSIKIPRNKSVDDLAKFGIKRTNVHVSPIAVCLRPNW